MSTLRTDQQTDLGQFFTPARAADLIASMPRLPMTGRFRILDPGAGPGSLTAAIVARILAERPALQVEIVAVELDGEVAAYLRRTLSDIEQTGADAGTLVTTTLVQGDFIGLSTGPLSLASEIAQRFDLVIMNPPYRKLGLADPHRQALAVHGAECPNLYAAFLALGVSCLRSGGQLVAITPRSFANGPYFGQFRKFLLDRVALDRIHVFESRSTVFSDTGVLQENVIVSATRDGVRDIVQLGISQGHADEVVVRTIPYSDVVMPDDERRFIRILSADSDTAVAETVAAMPASLADLGVSVSTGRVVDFRSRECLLPLPEVGSYPLIYPGNVRGGVIEWPRDMRKSQAFGIRTRRDEKLLLPEGHYVVVKRFSSKEERRRVVAGIWDPTLNSGPVAFENHLNILHVQGGGLDRNLAVGLSYWLNSSIVDSFFRTFSGHTQVNATDLRTLRFPGANELRGAGADLDTRLPDQSVIDTCVARLVTVAGGVAA